MAVSPDLDLAEHRDREHRRIVRPDQNSPSRRARATASDATHATIRLSG
jgi:hypothetical protein